MYKEQGKKLLEKYFTNNRSSRQKDIVELWYMSRWLKNTKEQNPVDYMAMKDEMWNDIENRIKPTPTIGKTWVKILVAAILLVFLSTTIYILKQQHSLMDSISTQNNIEPGELAATLFLTNGKTIDLKKTSYNTTLLEGDIILKKLNDGTISIQMTDSSKIQELGNIPLVIKTNNGETISIQLMDGTKVWLNAASSLSFLPNLKYTNKRMVQLTGEAYFEVAKSSAHFIVQSNDHKVEVLGTHFNINAYQINGIKTTLLEGKVQVGYGPKSKILLPGQQSQIENARIKVDYVDTETVIAWKNGEFVFKDANLSQVLETISRWYNISVEYHVQPDNSIHFDGEIARSSSIDDVIQMLEATGEVKFQQKGRRLILIK